MPRTSRRAATQAKYSMAAAMYSDSEEEAAAARQLTRNEVSEKALEDYAPPDEVEEDSDEDRDTASNVSAEFSIRPSLHSDKTVRTTGVAQPRQRRSDPAQAIIDQGSTSRSRTRDSVSDIAENLGPRTQTKPTRFGRRRHADGSKEDNLFSLLGEHIDVESALALRKAWGSEVRGPARSLVDRFRYKECITITQSTLKKSDQNEVLIRDLTEIDSYIPAVPDVKVQFILPGSLEPLSMEMPVHASHESGVNANRSVTFHTGLLNKAISWRQTGEKEKYQYLAVGGTHVHARPSPLFSLESGPGCVQIWRISVGQESNFSALNIVYAHDFGHTWKLKWCPAASDGETHLGFLAGVFGDGSIRIWSVAKNEDERSEIEYRKLTSPAYTLRVPDSGCVSFDWISRKSLAAGCMNGMFVVWDLEIDSECPVSVGHPHATYINNMVSCGPTAKDVVITTSWDCDLKLSNIWQADAEFLPASRERTVAYAAAWSDFLNCAIVNEDQRNVRLVSMRGGYSANLASMTGTVTALATNPSHPFLAIGDASGCLIITNTCRKAMWKKHSQFRRRVYQLDWSEREDAYRFTENFEIDEMTGKNSSNKSITTIIYPRQVGVNAIEWNGNTGFEGLLASCTEKFVRIDDMTIHDQ